MTVKELYQTLGKIINQGYGDCIVTTNLEDDGYSLNYNFITEVDSYLDRNNKYIINLFEE